MHEEGLKLASSSWDQEELEALQQVISSGQFSMGAAVSAFEEKFARAMGSKYAVMVNSGSSANLLMIASLFYTSNSKLAPGDEVIVPAVSWSTTYFPLFQYGLKLIFVDVDLETLNYDLNALQGAITSKTRLVVAVNLLGNPNEFNQIRELLKGKDIQLVEDNCESMGAKYNGKFTGTFGIIGSFSTYFSHHISTMEGGILVTDDEEIYHILLSLRSHGWTRHLPRENLVTGTKSDDDFEESFKFVLPGYNVRPIEMMGAIGIKQLEKLPALVDFRRLNAKHFQEIMSDRAEFIIQKEIGESSWFGFSLIIRPNTSMTRAELRKKLDQLGVEYRPIVAGNFTRNSVCKLLNHEVRGELHSANWLHEYGLFIGNEGRDLRKQLDGLSFL